VPKEWDASEDAVYGGSLLSLKREIHTLVNSSRMADERLNVRELIAPITYDSGAASGWGQALPHMLKEVAAARGHLALLSEKLAILSTELSGYREGGVA